ncbi:helix-turn-helix domain-containing protein [Catenuloplanes japonicus]|uniref:helix-turn-helix domain-containing protein n=1 Tax=Catenuloplanes japonicus TaxID=33876 RepID=UPI0018DBD901|nr:helix-turn-helix transcriptional regulator [Catenuloplanes japonicus]
MLPPTEGPDMTQSDVGDAGDVFWNDLAEDLKDPDFLRAFIIETLRIAAVDRIVNELDEARTAAGLSKAALSRASGTAPQTVRRLLTTTQGSNPTLGTVAELAAPLGLRLTLEPIPEDEHAHTVEPLLSGMHGDIKALTDWLRVKRQDIAVA